MAAIFVTTTFAVFFLLTFVAWRRYLWASEKVPQADTCPYSLTDVFDDHDQYFVDYCHLSEAGAERIAERLLPYVKAQIERVQGGH